ncbi:AAA family ATPase [Methanothermococcus sp. Ax23]|uniref:AAA family ATPase n=1 Tax=Methanothermococcus sp. Ax23 TaxID=3156486 RepID=UPI003BA1C18E
MEFENKIFDKMDKILERKKQIILYGVPGVGKTYLAKKFIENQINHSKIITFHQTFAYEEFIEGLKPKTEMENIIYEVEDGIFKKMCILAIWEALKNKYNKIQTTLTYFLNDTKLSEELNFLICLFKDYLETEKGKELIKEYENTKKEFSKILNRVKNDEKIDGEYLDSLNFWHLDWHWWFAEEDRINELLRLALTENNNKKLFSSFLKYFEYIEPATEFLCKIYPDKFILIDENVVDFAYNFLDIEFEYSDDMKWGDYKRVLDKFAEFKYLLEQRFNKKLDYLFVVYFIKNNHFFPLMNIFKEKYPPESVFNTVRGISFKIKDYLEEDEYSNEKIILEKNHNKIITIDIITLRDIWLDRYNINRPSDIRASNRSYIYPILEELKKIEIEYLDKYSLEHQNSIKIGNIKFDNINDYEQIKQKVINAIKNKELTKDDFQDAPKYYLIIDEINRGNISNILGELITLLEKDKRLGGEDGGMIVELPYSKEPFAVPPNLYIIGTMNTADKSIALLDTALRRRFGFLEIEPIYDLITKDSLIKIWKNKCDDEEFNNTKKDIEKMFKRLGNDEFLKKLLETINTKITLLKDRDHRIGHSYFLNVKDIDDLRFVWYNEIIPLLMEYFYNDWECLKEILKGFIDDKKPNIKINYDLIDDDLKLYEIKEYEGKEFIKALNSVIT